MASKKRKKRQRKQPVDNLNKENNTMHIEPTMEEPENLETAGQDSTVVSMVSVDANSADTDTDKSQSPVSGSEDNEQVEAEQASASEQDIEKQENDELVETEVVAEAEEENLPLDDSATHTDDDEADLVAEPVDVSDAAPLADDTAQNGNDSTSPEVEDKADEVSVEADKEDVGSDVEQEEMAADAGVEKVASKENEKDDDKTAVAPAQTVKRKRPAPKKRKRASMAKVVFFNCLKAAFVLVCMVAIAVSLFAVKLSRELVDETKNDYLTLSLETIKLEYTSQILARKSGEMDMDDPDAWVTYQELDGYTTRTWIPLDQMSPYMKDAIIAIEDREFENHHGFNFKRTVYAGLNQLFGFDTRDLGSSTLDQQLVKNLTGDDDVTTSRKIREIYRAWQLNNNYSKDQILEAYLNTFSLSGKIAGVEAAAQEYFGVKAADLTLEQCATIAGITQSPTEYSPFTNPEACEARRNQVLKAMYDTEKITKGEYDAAVAKPLELVRTSESDQTSGKILTTFSDRVVKEAITALAKAKGCTEDEASRLLFSQGYNIKATIDIEAQNAVDAIYEHGYDQVENGAAEDGYFASINGYIRTLTTTVELEDEDGNPILDENGKPQTTTVLPQSALVMLNYKGELMAVAGGIGEKTGSRVHSRATDSFRQTGSAMKPIAAYALGLEDDKISYSTVLKDAYAAYSNGSTTGGAVNPETGEPAYNWPGNAGGAPSGEGKTVVQGFAASLNTIAVRVGQRVGIDRMYDFLTDSMHVTTLKEDDKALAPLVLGALTKGMTPYELAACYQIFGNGGMYNTPHALYSIEDRYGNIIAEPEIISEQVISPETAFVMNKLLYSVTHGTAGSYGTAAGMYVRDEMDSIGKTGTSDRDRDRWYVGLTPYYVTSVWWGYDDNQEGYQGLGRWSRSAYSNVPVMVWKDLMEELQTNKEVIDFPMEEPDTVVTRAYCAVTGDIAGGGCPVGGTGYFNKNLPRAMTPCAGGHAAPEEDPSAAPPA